MSDGGTRRHDVVGLLQQIEPDIKALGARSLFLFGSVARDEARSDSDIDLFLDPDPARPFGFDDFMNVHEFLRDRLGPATSVTTREGLHPLMRETIEATAIKVF